VECSICYEKLGQGSSVVEASCGHRFHVKCASKWAVQSETCPLCRQAFDASTLQRVLPDVVSRVSKIVFSVSGVQRRNMLEMMETLVTMIKNDNVNEIVFVPPPPPDLYSYIELDNDVEEEDDEGDDDYMV
jgi:hypothetical protein